MKLITCIVRPERLPEVREALFRAGVTGLTISRVRGHGGERPLVETYRATAVAVEFRDKIRIEMVCSEAYVQPTLDAIMRSARTGEVGDGKIFVLPIAKVVRIRTGECDDAALTPLTADDVQRRALEITMG